MDSKEELPTQLYTKEFALWLKVMKMRELT